MTSYFLLCSSGADGKFQQSQSTFWPKTLLLCFPPTLIRLQPSMLLNSHFFPLATAKGKSSTLKLHLRTCLTCTCLFGDPANLQTELRLLTQYQLNTEQYQIYGIGKNKTEMLNGIFIHIYQQSTKRWWVTHPFCILTTLMHIYVNTHAQRMHHILHLATYQRRWP